MTAIRTEKDKNEDLLSGKVKDKVECPYSCPNWDTAHTQGDWWPKFSLELVEIGWLCHTCGCFLAVDGRVWVNRKRRKDLDIEPNIIPSPERLSSRKWC